MSHMTTREMITQSVCLYNKFDVEELIEDMADVITEEMYLSNPIILCVMNGGLMFTSQLMANMTFPLEFDYCQVSRYGNDEVGGELKWKKCPEIDMKDRTVIICDDIFDTGHTMVAISDYCKAHGAKEVKIAVLVNKTARNEVELKPDYCGANIPDLWVFGCGMDDSGYWRNLPEIRYMK